MQERNVVVTTEHRGVFFGRLISFDGPSRRAKLKDARNAVHWSADVRGFLGLAATGPTAGCRIGPAVPELQLEKVTSIADCTEEAVTRWEAAPWAS